MRGHRPTTTLSMAPIQNVINDQFKLESSDYYGSLFEFIDKRSAMDENTSIIDIKVRNIQSKVEESMVKEQDKLV